MPNGAGQRTTWIRGAPPTPRGPHRRTQPPRHRDRAGRPLRPTQDSSFRIDHVPGSAEPLLWVADIVAGTARASHHGGTAQRELLGERVHLLEVHTGC